MPNSSKYIIIQEANIDEYVFNCNIDLNIGSGVVGLGKMSIYAGGFKPKTYYYLWIHHTVLRNYNRIVKGALPDKQYI